MGQQWSGGHAHGCMTWQLSACLAQLVCLLLLHMHDSYGEAWCRFWCCEKPSSMHDCHRSTVVIQAVLHLWVDLQLDVLQHLEGARALALFRCLQDRQLQTTRAKLPWSAQHVSTWQDPLLQFHAAC